jgi:hypothetical protein
MQLRLRVLVRLGWARLGWAGLDLLRLEAVPEIWRMGTMLRHTVRSVCKARKSQTPLFAAHHQTGLPDF